MKTINIESCRECPYCIGTDIPNNHYICEKLSLQYETKFCVSAYWGFDKLHPHCPLQDQEKAVVGEIANDNIKGFWCAYCMRKVNLANDKGINCSICGRPIVSVFDGLANKYNKLKQFQRNIEDTRNSILGITQEEHNANLKKMEERAREEERQCLDTLQQFVQEKITPTYKLLIGKNVDEAILYYIKCLETEIDGFHKKEKEGFYRSFKELVKEDVDFLEWIYQRLIHIHGENENYDYMHKFREILNKLKGV